MGNAVLVTEPTTQREKWMGCLGGPSDLAPVPALGKTIGPRNPPIMSLFRTFHNQ